ncbi:MAG TPA: DUF302 domain-containing protein [Candidatus Baltobacteraceae bacterium]|nr:DUF302 domain-containing protein [Candidatus Baltobacteraceae bacterium]
MRNALQKTAYGTVVASDLPPDEAVERVRALLKDEGFGVLCEIDVGKTLHEKLGEDFRPYRILGACNPALAYQALSADPQLGLLLPCNVVVQQESGHSIVSAIDAAAMMNVANNPALLPIAREANARLQRVIERMAQT